MLDGNYIYYADVEECIPLTKYNDSIFDVLLNYLYILT